MRRLLGHVLTAGLICAVSPRVGTQAVDLRIVQAGPSGEVAQISDANEIRVIFSEPMVALGRIPSNPTPPWIHITPAVPGSFRWSGTTILVFAPDPATPLPHATRFSVTIDATATSDAGHALGQPFTFTFTTPTVRLTSMRWYRRQDRFDQPAVLVLGFNQRVTPTDVLAHVTARYSPYDWQAPAFSDAERARLEAIDPTGLTAFNARVAAAQAAAARRDRVAVRLAADWDRLRFPPRDSQVVLETTTVPPPGTRLELTLDSQMPGADGAVTPPQPQRSTAEFDPVFLAIGFVCRTECDPSGYNGLRLSRPVSVAAFARALAVRDITSASRDTVIAQKTAVPATSLDRSSAPGLEDAGYDRQAPASTFAYSLAATLQSTDGQTLGYPWVGIVDTWHERPFTSFGDGHGVWEAGGGPQLPFYARNYQSITEWLTRLDPADLMPRILALEKGRFEAVPEGPGTPRRLAVLPDQTQSYGIDVTPALPTGLGLVWAGLRPGTPIPRSRPASSPTPPDRSAIVQVTNLGITVKDSPQSTLIFVTRLDTGEAVDEAAVSIVDAENRKVWQGRTGRDGVAMAPALPLREPDRWYDLSFIVTAEKAGDVAYLASNWNEGIMAWDFDLPYQLWEATDILRGSVFTDRGVYKPGELVHAKAIVRADTPTGVRLLPAGSQLDILVHDVRNKEVDRRRVTLTRWSSAEWDWTVPASGTLGQYPRRGGSSGHHPGAPDRQRPRTPAGRGLVETRLRIVSGRRVSTSRLPGGCDAQRVDTRGRGTAGGAPAGALSVWFRARAPPGALVADQDRRPRDSLADPRSLSGGSVRVRLRRARRTGAGTRRRRRGIARRGRRARGDGRRGQRCRHRVSLHAGG